MFFRRAPPPAAKPAETEADKKETDKKQADKKEAAKKTSAPPGKSNPIDDDDDDDDFFGKKKTTIKKKSKAELDGMSNQELEHYAVDQAQETTKSVNNALKIAEDIKSDAGKTLDTLHAQGEQIHRTHEKAADMEKDLSRGEKILGSLGGMFSMTWKPKKGKEIKGPEPIDNGKGDKKASKEQREKLGLEQGHKGKKDNKKGHGEAKSAMQKVEVEKEKQDEALDDLSDILGDLKGMATEMGSELDRQNKALDDLSEDVDEINTRVKGANTRARKLLDK
ncbi:putative SNAP25 homologous protein SNAP30 [Lactuca sativa]|uniref:t-SNARE coiled-coil homology domain-containing protein n=1 Tax=Lactuca sativa TaxID=4236 RepID=A0A9R1URK4_LACSA|nr:putative SNAP25 homologous protein SNAP30 [Lactuca sativa]KAJ0192193.1 hypothetical protein LSAT_V11C800407740 [Lactuca sativa]